MKGGHHLLYISLNTRNGIGITMSNIGWAKKAAELRDLAEKLAPENDYLPGTAARVARTLSFASKHQILETELMVGEIGPGLLILSENVAAKNTIAFGLFGASGNRILEDQGIALAEFDLNAGPIPDQYRGKVDTLYFCEVIEHLNRWPIDVLADIKELLSPEGLLILTTPNVCRLTTRLRLLTGKTPLADYFEKVGDGHNHVREFGLEEVEYYCRKAGLSVAGSELWSVYPRGPAGKFATLVAKLFPRTSNFLAIAARRRSP